MTSPPSGRYELIRKLHQFQQSSCVELGTLQELSLSVIVKTYKDHGDAWKESMPCIPKDLRREICKRLMYRGTLDNALFALSMDEDRRVWDFRSVRENFTDESCKVLAQVKALEILRLTHSSCSSAAMAEMVQNFTNLQLLEIIHTNHMNDYVLRIVAENCPKLEVLNVKATEVTDEGMLSLRDKEIKLSELDISYTSISQEGIDYLKSGPMKDSLRLLRFKSCKKLGSAKIVRDIIVCFPNLKDYSFYFNGEDESEIGRALELLPQPVAGQNVFFNIPL